MSIKSEDKVWIFHAEWITSMVTMVGCFLFVHHESVKCNERLDAHITAINQRCDDLHKEFYALLKEMRK